MERLARCRGIRRSLVSSLPCTRSIVPSIASSSYPYTPMSLHSQTFSISQRLYSSSVAATSSSNSFVTVKSARDASFIGKTISVRGWARSVRSQKNVGFVELNDGSSLGNLQIVFPPGLLDNVHTGCSVTVTGKIIESIGSGQATEMQGHTIDVIGSCDPSLLFPLQKKRHPLEYLREIVHLRPRTNMAGAVLRLRSSISSALHSHLQSDGFIYVHTPLLTSSDCEGAGEQFAVITEKHLQEWGNQRERKGAKATVSSPSVSASSVSDLPSKPSPQEEKDPLSDFFGKRAFLTVSGQLQAEMFACALSKVYTFGPTFRAENSHTARHLAEFWMLEPEMAFCGMDENIAAIEGCLKAAARTALENNKEDLEFFAKHVDKNCISRIESVLKTSFSSSTPTFNRMTYTEAIDILKRSGRTFVHPVDWNDGLHSEHERYLCEEYCGGTPLFVTDYPASIKPFYARLNDDGMTVGAVDMLLPGIGEVVGGSVREERYDLLLERMQKSGLREEDYRWYLDLRRFGTVPHAGFGMGFERLIMWLTGVENVRDAIPVPRVPGQILT